MNLKVDIVYTDKVYNTSDNSSIKKIIVVFLVTILTSLVETPRYIHHNTPPCPTTVGRRSSWPPSTCRPPCPTAGSCRCSWPTCTCRPLSTDNHRGAHWSYPGIKMNKLVKIINGNRRLGYNLALWNCRRGLLCRENIASYKMLEVRDFLNKKKLHMLCLVESDLHSDISRYKRTQPLSTRDIMDKLDIPGYNIYLPATWNNHGQARIIVYAKEELQVKQLVPENCMSDLPSISFLISIGKEKKTLVNFFYREFTGGVSGLSDLPSQNERLVRQINHWRNLCNSKRDFVSLGDANLCSLKWHDNDYYLQDQSAMVQSFLLDNNCSQLVKSVTRSEITQGGQVSRSCIDHCYTNVPEKMSEPCVEAVGDSDHLGIVVTKFSRAEPMKPKTVKKRSYKYFNMENLLVDIANSNIDRDVTECDNIEDAAKVFEESFKPILDKHALIKTFQVRKHYAPYVSDSTKKLMKERKELKELAANTGDKEAEKKAKKKGKEIKKALKEDEKIYYEKDFGENMDASTAWRTVKVVLGDNNNLAPTAIKTTSEKGEVEIVSNPKKLANLFNNFFRSKIKQLREKTDQPPLEPPIERLRKWLSQRTEPPPPFQIKPINKKMLRTIIKKVKAKRVHGVDWIDSFSLKIACPLIEDTILHLVNLSIIAGSFPSRWKPQLIFPLHKKKEKDSVSNYRPVSHLVQVGKIVEYTIYFQIVEHFVKNDLFHPNHHGSLPHHSTATAITQIFDMCIQAADSGELSALCLLDQSAAYDLLCHQTLEKKLKLYNFSELSIRWLMSYLGGRTQLVQVESRTSKELGCDDSAVPQGSVLGGLIHIINSNDLPACHDDEVGESVVYVDDNSDFTKDEDPAVLNANIQSEAEKSTNWLKDNRLCVAGEKSKLLILGHSELRAAKNLNEPRKIYIDGKEVLESESEKLLGLVINNTLTWKNHLYGDQENTGLVSQLGKRLGMLSKLSKFMSKEKLRYFSNGIFYSKLNYCLHVFGNVFGMDTYKESIRKYKYCKGNLHAQIT